MQDTINLNNFLKSKELLFESEKQAIAWVRRNLKPKSLIKAGPNYLVSSREMETLFKSYISRQEEIYKDKVERVKELRQRKESNTQ